MVSSVGHMPDRFYFFFSVSGYHRHLHSFPTRRSSDLIGMNQLLGRHDPCRWHIQRRNTFDVRLAFANLLRVNQARSEEHTSELQSLRHLVCRLLLEKKK